MDEFENFNNGAIVDPNKRVDGEMRKPTKVVKEWVENGEVFKQYESGIIRNDTTNRIVKGLDKPFFDKNNVKAVARLRKEKAAKAIRNEIVKKMQKTNAHLTSASEAIGVTAGVLWEEIVINKAAPARDRLQTWLMIGKQAGLLEDLRERTPDNPEGVRVELGVDLARDIIDKMLQKRRE